MAISKLMNGSQDQHELVRASLFQFIEANKDAFRPYCPSETPSLEEHLLKIQRTLTWGTHLEIYAAATMLQVPVYVCTQKDGTLA